jgi:hypothetical protein
MTMTTNTETNLNLDIDDFAPDEHFLVHDDGVLRTRTVPIWPHTAEAWLR